MGRWAVRSQEAGLRTTKIDIRPTGQAWGANSKKRNFLTRYNRASLASLNVQRLGVEMEAAVELVGAGTGSSTRTVVGVVHARFIGAPFMA